MSDRVSFQHEDANQITLNPGHWTHAQYHGEAGGAVIICCPDCGQPGCISRGESGHSISADGDVEPSVVCPNDDCEFHAWATLEGYHE